MPGFQATLVASATAKGWRIRLGQEEYFLERDAWDVLETPVPASEFAIKHKSRMTCDVGRCNHNWASSDHTVRDSTTRAEDELLRNAAQDE